MQIFRSIRKHEAVHECVLSVIVVHAVIRLCRIVDMQPISLIFWFLRMKEWMDRWMKVMAGCVSLSERDLD